MFILIIFIFLVPTRDPSLKLHSAIQSRPGVVEDIRVLIFLEDFFALRKTKNFSIIPDPGLPSQCMRPEAVKRKELQLFVKSK